jgi:hypothetical protein
MNLQIFNHDFRDLVGDRNYKMIFADPPDNIGLEYEGFSDTMSRSKYRDLLWDTLHTITRCEILWVSRLGRGGSVVHAARHVRLLHVR